MVSNATYPGLKHEGVVPASDMAGEIVVVGSDVKKWQVGDRVCANFTQTHLHGDLTPLDTESALGGAVDGVLTEYRAFSERVSTV